MTPTSSSLTLIPKHYGLYLTLYWLNLVLRFVVLAPTIYYQTYSTNNHNVVSDNVLLHNGTYDATIMTGERVANWWGSFVFLWNIAIWLPGLLLQPPLHLPVVAVDTMITVHLSRATNYQSAYVPKHKQACSDMSIFDDMRPRGTNESFFAAAARLNETVTTPAAMCVTFVQEWQYGVTLCFFYALISLFGIIAFIGCIRLAKQQALSLWSVIKGTCGCFCVTMGLLAKGILKLIPILLYYTPVFFFRVCLPIQAQGPVRAARRYTVKAALGAEQKTEIALDVLRTELSNKNDIIGRYQGAQGEPTPLAQFLGIYDMLMIVTQHLHYVDLLNLSCVSKSVRNSVLPHNDLYRRLTVFKQYTCSELHKSPCSVCSTQVCGDCYKVASIPQVIPLHHLENCMPYCKSCYYQNIVLSKSLYNARLKDTACKCAPAPPQPLTIYQRLSNLRTRGVSTQHLRTVSISVCRECDQLPAEELMSKKVEATKVMLKKGQKNLGQKWDACARQGCEKRLDNGPRFWICSRSNCGKECTSVLHQAWGQGSKDVEEAV